MSAGTAAWCCFSSDHSALALLTRCALLVKAAHDVTWDASLLTAFGWGLLFDIGAAAWFSLPLVVVLTLLPARFFARRWGRIAAHVLALAVIYLLVFDTVAEWVFWDEFGVRFNFIAVDYLVYTHEVTGNIRESYPMPLILSSLGAGALLVYVLVRLTAAGALAGGGRGTRETTLPCRRGLERGHHCAGRGA